MIIQEDSSDNQCFELFLFSASEVLEQGTMVRFL